MVFSSTVFVFFFLPITLLGYYLIPWRGKNALLLIVSLIFFAWSQPGYLWIILLNIAVNYLGSMLLSGAGSDRVRRCWFILTIAVNLGLLFYFKYFNFTVDTFNQLTGASVVVDEIILPIGISFFTFQGMSYTMDVFMRKVEVQRNPFKVALYIVLFPQLIAGPIVRYIDIEKEIDHRRISVDDFAEGAQRFIIGLAKKVLLANTFAVTIDAIWNNGIGQSTTAVAWVGSIAYSLQIFFDFSGYSDMAIGLGRMFGFHFLENFRLPYIAKSITDFWRRWHISLSSWFRDYVYIPLGGNRRHVYLNIAVVFLLTGIWHGAAWQFILWGVMHGIFRLIERYCTERGWTIGALDKIPAWIRSALAHAYTLFVVNIGWVLFRAPNLSQGFRYISIMFGRSQAQTPGYSVWWYLDRWTLCMLVMGILFSSIIPTKIGEALSVRLSARTFMVIKYIALIVLLFFTMLRIVSGTYNPFIYFQF